MLRLATRAGSVPAPRVLNRVDVERALAAFRLPSYTWLLSCLEDYELRVRVVEMWEKVFGGLPDDAHRYSAFDLECEFVGKVHYDLFPVDLDFMDSIYNGGDNPLDLGICIDGEGIPWEMVAIDDIHPAAALVLAVAWQSGAVEPPEATHWRGTTQIFDDEIAEYWDLIGYDPPAWGRPRNAEGLRAFHRALIALDPPLNALGDILTVLLKTSGNPFLDTVPTFWQMEYDGGYDYWTPWDATCVREMAEIYEPARPIVERLDAYYKLYRQNEPAERARALAALTAAAAGETLEATP